MARSKPTMEKVWADTGTKLEPSDAKKDLGHIVEIPDYRVANWLENRRDQFLAHINDWGTPQWDSASDYPVGAWSRSAVDGEVYVSKTTPNQGNEPSISATEWETLSDNLSDTLMAIISGGTVGNIVTVAANGQVQDSGTSLQDVLSQLSPEGNWNASTNTPDIAATATTGDFWIVSVAGSTSLDGITDWEVNDWAVKTSTGWAKVDNTTSLTSDELSAIQGANSPSGSNVFATANDISGIGGIVTGMIVPYGGGTAPAGYLLCQGQEVAQATYANLFSVLGTAYNTGGEGAGNFRVPDLQGRVVVGSGSGVGLTARAIGDQGGAETHQLTTAEMPSHTHTAQDQTSNALAGIGPSSQGFKSPANTGSAGGDGAHNNIQPFTVANYVIRT